ncbi:MAG: protein translocase subunit SecD, partial [Kiritimatiellaeota bacterium]|nr:protein translocase subunit SecD [Kiritimatiellota bacterium]
AGIENPVIAKGGDAKNRIYVQLPGADDKRVAEAEELLKKDGLLEFRMVHSNNTYLATMALTAETLPAGYVPVRVNGKDYFRRASNYAELSSFDGYAGRLARFGVPPGDSTTVMMMKQTREDGSAGLLYTPVYVNRRPVAGLSGENLTRIEVETDPMTGGYQIAFALDSDGARVFGRTTAANIGQQMAIILDGVIHSDPVIKDAITQGRGTITGRFSLAEANELRVILKAGKLKAPLKVIERRMVSPSLGQDAIDGAKKAALWGVGLILLFMLFYYRYCGIVANIAVALDIILLPLGAVIAGGVLGVLVPEISAGGGGGFMKLPVLTLPGIAGILLTLGMAVDGNVLIYERIREEQAQGKKGRAAILAGHDRAFLAILDSNLTTILTAAILFIFGTGLIRGFAVMLTAGLIVSMFTVLVVTKLVLLATTSEESTRTFGMTTLFPETMRLPFTTWFKPYAWFAVVACVALTAIAIVRGAKDPAAVFAVDLTGGAKITYAVDDAQTLSLDAVRAAAAAIGIEDAAPQYQQNASGRSLLEVRVGRNTVRATVEDKEVEQDVSTALTEALKAKHPEANVTQLDVDAVGTQIGGEMRKSAVKAFVLALIGILLYLAMRFEWSFGLGAVVSLFHVIVLTVGIYLALGNQISSTIIAAILTIVGYSVNDTIVIFDRIREELRRDQKTPIADLCNLCLNKTLSRTVITSLTTLFTVVTLYLFGYGDIKDFALIMVLGIIVGTLSSVFVATPVMLRAIHNRRPTFGKKS